MSSFAKLESLIVSLLQLQKIHDSHLLWFMADLYGRTQKVSHGDASVTVYREAEKCDGIVTTQ